jgi:Family of unknown function (DUF5519)
MLTPRDSRTRRDGPDLRAYLLADRHDLTETGAVGLQAPFYDRGVGHDPNDMLWEAFVAAMLDAGPAVERRSRYGDKPALFTASREIAHLEAPGVIDLRITRAGWSRARDEFADDPAVRHDPSRRDWIELHPRSAGDLDRLAALLIIALAANA